MRIAFITFEYPPFIIGGAGVYAFNISRELAKLGHKVVVLTPNVSNTSELKLDNLEVRRIHVINKLPFKAIQFWLRLPGEIRKLEQKDQFDVLHFNGLSYWFFKKRLSKAKNVITIHHLVKDAVKNNNLNFFSRLRDFSGENSFFISFIEMNCVKYSDKLIAVSNFTKKQIIMSYKVKPDQIKVIYNGIDLSSYEFTREELLETKKQLNLTNKYILLFVGRVDDPRKGLNFLLKSIKKLLETIDVTLLVVGRGNQIEARNLTNLLGISNNVIFTGYVDDLNLKKYYSVCDVYVCPSKLEGFGLTLVEAMSAGKPIVATNVGAIPEIIGNYGLIVDFNDEVALCEAIIKLLDSKDGLSQKIFSKTCNFSWDTAGKETENLYLKVIGT